MSPAHLRCGVRAGAMSVGIGGVALASVHFSGHHFSDVSVVGGVICLILVAGFWLMAEEFYMLAERAERNGDRVERNGERIDRFRAETRDRYETLQRARTDAEAIGAWAARKTFDLMAPDDDDGDRAEVVGLNGHRRR